MDHRGDSLPQGTGLSKLTQQDLDLGDMTTSEELAKTFLAPFTTSHAFSTTVV
jgi:hypothetical protein